VEGVPTHGSGVGTRWPLKSLVLRKNVFMNMYLLKEGRGGRRREREDMHFVYIFEGRTDSSK